MAYIFTDGFDCYAAPADMVANYWDSASVLTTMSFVAGRFAGSQGLSTASSGFLIKTSGQNDAIHHFSIAIQQTVALSGTTNWWSCVLYDGTTAQCSVVFRSDGSINLIAGIPTGTVLATYSGAITAVNTWFQFEIEVRVSNTAGFMNVRKLGNVTNDFSSATNLDTAATANDYANKVQFGPWAGTAGNQLADDFLWRSDSVANGVPWVGDIRCQTRRPVSDASVQWTPAAATVQQTLWTGTVTSVGAAINRVVYTAFTARGDGTIASVTLTVNTALISNMKCAIYNSNGSVPTTVVGVVSAQVTNPGSGSLTITFSTPPTVIASNPYFLAVAFDGSTGNIWGVSNSTGWVGTTTYASFPVNNPGSLSANNNCSSSLTITPTYANTGQVCDPQQDGAASYVYSSTVGQSDLYGISSIATTPASIVAVTTRAFLQKSDAGTRIVRLQLKSGGTTVQSSDVVLNTVWGWGARTDTVDPATGAAWTAVGVNNAQVGVVVTA